MQVVHTPDGPIAPSKIVCVGRNYVAHIEELGNEVPEEPVLFLKPNSAIADALHASREGETLHYEAELCFLMMDGRPVAVAPGLDLTRRALQARLKERGLPWERAKAFDGSALFGPFVALSDTRQLTIELAIDDRIVQRGDTSLMLYPPEAIVEEVSRCMSFEDGDVLMTGTPGGVGPVEAGAHFEASVHNADGRLSHAWWQARA
jgi:2-keto-4-pentenoate hydratase/2-oxohepta-3-ene-1,7-dioic acid hydratase in catechol pathway